MRIERYYSMENKKCPYCFTEMDSRASVCPSCRKKIGSVNSKGIARKYYSLWSLLGIILMLIILIVIYGPIIGNVKESKPPKPDEIKIKVPEQSSHDIIHQPFEVVGIYKRSTFSIVVPKDTSQKQLINLIYDLKKARDGNYLNKYFPPTTSGGSMGDYATICIYVFSDKNKASDTLLSRYMECSSDSKSDMKFGQKYAENVSAYYFYHVLNNQEFGCLGLKDLDIKPSKKYKKLFASNVPY
jgi:hypothetical protein